MNSIVRRAVEIKPHLNGMNTEDGHNLSRSRNCLSQPTGVHTISRRLFNYYPFKGKLTCSSLLLTLLQCVRKVAMHLGYGTQIWLSVPKMPLKCALVSLYSVVKQWLKCNTGKVCNCLIQFLLTMVLSIEERVL
jgi:hypothetical protein